jgi:3-oxoacyl-ACP reductase-like protein
VKIRRVRRLLNQWQESAMSIFGNILGKIFHHDSAKAASAPSLAPAAAPQASTPAAQPAPETAAAPAAASQSSQVDVGQVLEAMASMKDDHGGNYKSSIVDLLKLLDLDSSLSARKELGQELGVHAGEDGSAEQNIALHRAVMDKLAENGGVVPDSLRQ